MGKNDTGSKTPVSMEPVNGKTWQVTDRNGVTMTQNDKGIETPVASLESIRLPWLHLVNPVTGNLPKNYKAILAKEEKERNANGNGVTMSQNDKGIETPVASLESIRLPWLHLVNPVTGNLPKNYKAILAKKEKERNANDNDAEMSKNITDSKTPDASLESIRLPWLHLVDSVTGELPKNYKAILAREERERNATVPSSSGTKNLGAGLSYSLHGSSKPYQLLNNKKTFLKKSDTDHKKVAGSATSGSRYKKRRSGSDSKIYKVTNMKTSPKKLQLESHARKKLFSPVVKKLCKPQNKRKNNLLKTNELSEVSNDSISLVNMSDFEKHVINRQSTKESENDSPRMIIDSPIPSGFDSSTREFMYLEEQLQTPIQNTKIKGVQSPDLRKIYIERFEQIVEQQSVLLEEMKDILSYLKTNSSNIETLMENKGADKENIPISYKGNSPASILTSAKKTDLRIRTLKKTVSFDANAKENVEKALQCYNMMKRNCNLLQTPQINTPRRMRRHLSEKVQLQCLMLQDTPKHK